jgi:biotin carboxylase
VQPRFALVHDVTVARATAGAFGYPVVLKPRGMGASIGVVRVNGPDELDEAFRISEAAGHGGAPAYEGGVLVEEFLTGPEISVDGALRDGGYTPFCLAHKRIGPAPFMEEIGHLVDPADPLLTDPGLLEVLATAHRVLGVRDGITHTELKLTPRGPAIVEVNARLGGDLIP